MTVGHRLVVGWLTSGRGIVRLLGIILNNASQLVRCGRQGCRRPRFSGRGRRVLSCKS